MAKPTDGLQWPQRPSASPQSMAASLLGPELLMLHIEPFTALLQFRINKCLCQLRDMGRSKIALTYNTSSLQFLSSSTTENYNTWCFQSWEEIKIFLLIFIMNKSSCRRKSAHTFRELPKALRDNILSSTPNPENGHLTVQNKTRYFWGGSLCQRSARKTELHAATSQVQPGLCLPAGFRRK